MTGCPPAPQWHLLNSGLSFPRAGAVSLAAGINPAGHRMDSQSKREIWLLAIGMVIVEAPIVAIAALAIAAAH